MFIDFIAELFKASVLLPFLSTLRAEINGWLWITRKSSQWFNSQLLYVKVSLGQNSDAPVEAPTGLGQLCVSGSISEWLCEGSDENMSEGRRETIKATAADFICIISLAWFLKAAA